METYVLAIDQGTTSSRAVLFNQETSIIHIAQQEFTQHFPQPGWVEHDPNELFDTQARVATACVRQAGVEVSQVRAVGIANQRESTIVWDKFTGQPIYPSIVWQDRRTAALCSTLRQQGHEALIREKTGLLLDPYFSAPKIRWILDNVPDARHKADKGDLLFGTVDSWLIWNFTKGEVHVTDPSNASRTLLFNIHSLQWDDELLQLFGVPRTMLPTLVPSSGEYGSMHPEFLGRSIPLSGIAGDQQAATFGNACLSPGMIKNTYGTGCFMLMNTGSAPRVSENHLLSTVGWQHGGKVSYALEGSIFMGGAVVQWLRDGLGIISRSSEVEALARSVPDNGGLYLVPAFVGLGAPYWDSHARGIMVGLTRGITKAHIARAALEAIALQSLDIMDCMAADAGLLPTTLRVDGGASRNNMLMQFQADILGVPVERPKVTETTAFGAAALAGLAANVWDGEHDLVSHWQLDRRFEPHMSLEQRGELRHHWHRAVERAQGWEEKE